MGCSPSKTAITAAQPEKLYGSARTSKIVPQTKRYTAPTKDSLEVSEKEFALLTPDPYAKDQLLSMGKQLEEFDRKQNRVVSQAEPDLIALPKPQHDVDTQREMACNGTADQAGTECKQVTSAASEAATAILTSPEIQNSVSGNALLEELKSGALSAQQIQQIFSSTLAISRSPDFFLTVGELLIQKHEPLMAEDVLYNGTKQHPSHTRLRRVHALALAQGGSTERAISALESLRTELGAAFDDETGGLLARCYKDLATRQKSQHMRQEYLEKAYQLYKETYERSDKTSYYTGINTATMALLLGKMMEAQAVAAEVVALCEKEAQSWKAGVPKGGYWVLATLGEANLIAGNVAQSFYYYAKAAKEAGDDFVKISSTKRQLQLLLGYIHINEDKILSVDATAVTAGHDGFLSPACVTQLHELRKWHWEHEHVPVEQLQRNGIDFYVDAATVKRASLSQSALADTAARICGCDVLRDGLIELLFDLPRVAVFITAELHDGVLPAPGSQAVMAHQFNMVLEKTNSKFGYASPCTAADIVFAETILRRGGEIYLVLPVPLDVHLKSCAEKFASIEKITGEVYGPYGRKYVEQHATDPILQQTCNSLLDHFPENSRQSIQQDASPSKLFDDYGVLQLANQQTDEAKTGDNEQVMSPSKAVVSPAFDALPQSNLMKRLRAVIAMAARVDISNDMSPDMSLTNRHYCSLILNGLAVMRASALESAVERIYMAPNVLTLNDRIGERPTQILSAESDGDEIIVTHDRVRTMTPKAASDTDSLGLISHPSKLTKAHEVLNMTRYGHRGGSFLLKDQSDDDDSGIHCLSPKHVSSLGPSASSHSMGKTASLPRLESKASFRIVNESGTAIRADSDPPKSDSTGHVTDNVALRIPPRPPSMHNAIGLPAKPTLPPHPNRILSPAHNGPRGDRGMLADAGITPPPALCLQHHSVDLDSEVAGKSDRSRKQFGTPIVTSRNSHRYSSGDNHNGQTTSRGISRSRPAEPSSPMLNPWQVLRQPLSQADIEPGLLNTARRSTNLGAVNTSPPLRSRADSRQDPAAGSPGGFSLDEKSPLPIRAESTSSHEVSTRSQRSQSLGGPQESVTRHMKFRTENRSPTRNSATLPVLATIMSSPTSTTVGGITPMDSTQSRGLTTAGSLSFRAPPSSRRNVDISVRVNASVPAMPSPRVHNFSATGSPIAQVLSMFASINEDGPHMVDPEGSATSKSSSRIDGSAHAVNVSSQCEVHDPAQDGFERPPKATRLASSEIAGYKRTITEVPVVVAATSRKASSESGSARPPSPDVLVSPTAAAVFAGIPSAVEQWVEQGFTFRVLFMDSVLSAETAELFECWEDYQVMAPEFSVHSSHIIGTLSSPVPPMHLSNEPAKVFHPRFFREDASKIEPAALLVVASASTPTVDASVQLIRDSTRQPSTSPASASNSRDKDRFAHLMRALFLLRKLVKRKKEGRASPAGSETARMAAEAQEALQAAGESHDFGTVVNTSTEEGILHSLQAAETLLSQEKQEKARLEAMGKKQVIMAILFADIVGYSKLAEMQVLTFVERFLGAVGALIDTIPSEQQPKVRNTWGDAVYFVFSKVPDAGNFALLLSDLVTQIPWWKLGLPKSLSIRISLHAAPVHPVVDPITHTKNYTGVHTSRAARIEPITPPGCVYCSQAFAAMSKTLCVSDYQCTYVGNMPLAKGYGLQPVYHLRWSVQQSAAQFREQLARRGDVLTFAPSASNEGSFAGREEARKIVEKARKAIHDEA